jgi:hypothetical protein
LNVKLYLSKCLHFLPSFICYMLYLTEFKCDLKIIILNHMGMLPILTYTNRLSYRQKGYKPVAQNSLKAVCLMTLHLHESLAHLTHHPNANSQVLWLCQQLSCTSPPSLEHTCSLVHLKRIKKNYHHWHNNLCKYCLYSLELPTNTPKTLRKNIQCPMFCHPECPHQMRLWLP